MEKLFFTQHLPENKQKTAKKKRNGEERDALPSLADPEPSSATASRRARNKQLPWQRPGAATMDLGHP